MRNKYNARKTICHNRHKHDSKLESNYCDTLSLLVKAGDIKSYEIQKRFDLTVNGKKVCSHIIDFWVERNDGEYEIHEAKGMETALWKLKYRIFKILYPNINYLVIK